MLLLTRAVAANTDRPLSELGMDVKEKASQNPSAAVENSDLKYARALAP